METGRFNTIKRWTIVAAVASMIAAIAGVIAAGPVLNDWLTRMLRARRATANRTLTVLKAAFNYAFHEGRIASDEAWRKVKPFREADASVVHYLSHDECRRLINTCQGSFRSLVQAALLTGCRYGELIRLRAVDFNADAGTIAVRESKAGAMWRSPMKVKPFLQH